MMEHKFNDYSSIKSEIIKQYGTEQICRVKIIRDRHIYDVSE